MTAVSAGPVEALLRRARARIENPERWTTGDYARAVDGSGRNAWARDAVCWCAWGALYVEGFSRLSTEDQQRIEALVKPRRRQGLVWLNDHADHELVLRHLDHAADRAQVEGW